MPLPFWAEWLGWAATLIALGITVWQSVKARKASELARGEVLRFRDVLNVHDLSASLAAGIEALDGLRRDGSGREPKALQDRFGRIRRTLAELAAGPLLSDNERTVALRSQGQIVRLSERVADAQVRPFSQRDRAEFEKVLMAEADALSGILSRLRRRIGDER
ncbi:MAG: hypothetical protein GC160_11445 [Acidobacteria bacterium]|nr:hypothetical protein [Acidobacteriota bacterium]